MPVQIRRKSIFIEPMVDDGVIGLTQRQKDINKRVTLGNPLNCVCYCDCHCYKCYQYNKKNVTKSTNPIRHRPYCVCNCHCKCEVCNP